MDTYVKTWLQLAFPVYVIILIVLIIIVSSHSTKFSNLIGKKDPVATLATLILLSYAKLVGVSFKSLSRGILVYPNRNVSLWLPDATIEYPSMNMDQSTLMATMRTLVHHTSMSWEYCLHTLSWSCSCPLFLHPQNLMQANHNNYAPAN